MTTKILVPLDGSAVAEGALGHAAALARTFGASIVLARVPEATLVPVMSAGVWITRVIETGEAHAEAEAYVRGVAARDELAGLDVSVRTPEHPVVEGLLDLVDAAGIDLIVMTTHGRSGPARWVMGSVAERIVRETRVSTYVVRSRSASWSDDRDRRRPGEGVREAGDREGGATADATAAPDLSRVIVPLDGSELAEMALGPAETIVAASGGSLVLVRVPVVPGYLTFLPETAGWIPEQLRESAIEAERYLSERAAIIAARGLDVETDVEPVLDGPVAEGIVRAAAEHRAGLIVMSSHGRTGLGRWFMGSVADRVLRGAECATWIVRRPTEG